MTCSDAFALFRRDTRTARSPIPYWSRLWVTIGLTRLKFARLLVPRE